jgi:hypothetical protein
MSTQTAPAPETALTTPAPTALAASPAAIGRGKETIGSEDMHVPRLSIAQKGSPQVDPASPKFIDGLKLYEMYNSVSKQLLGTGPVRLALVSFRKYAMEFDDQNAVVDPNVPLGDKRLEFRRGPNNKALRPQATLFMEYLAVDTETLDPIVVTFKGAGLSTAKAMNSLLRMSKGDLWDQEFHFTTERRTSGPFTFGAFVVNPGPATSPQVRQVAEALYQSFQKGDVKLPGADVPEHTVDDDVPF